MAGKGREGGASPRRWVGYHYSVFLWLLPLSLFFCLFSLSSCLPLSLHFYSCLVIIAYVDRTSPAGFFLPSARLKRGGMIMRSDLFSAVRRVARIIWGIVYIHSAGGGVAAGFVRGYIGVRSGDQKVLGGGRNGGFSSSLMTLGSRDSRVTLFGSVFLASYCPQDSL